MLTILRATVVALVLYLVVALELPIALAWLAVLVVLPPVGARLARSVRRPEIPQNVAVSITKR